MRILVVSDSHGQARLLQKAVRAQPKAEMILFLGDGYDEADALRRELPPEKFMRMVKGNNDWCCPEPNEQLFTVEGVKILMMHGHSRQVKWGIGAAEAEARRCGAQILLFGHTHIPCCEYRDGLHIINPGSLGVPLNGTPTYAWIDIIPEGISANIVKLPW